MFDDELEREEVIVEVSESVALPDTDAVTLAVLVNESDAVAVAEVELVTELLWVKD